MGDGGPATAARISLPGGVLVAPDGDLIVVDFGNHRVRRVDVETGLIHPVAGTGEPGASGDGGPAAQARLARPENAAFGPDGALYIVDSHNHRIRRIDPRTGIIRTVAGTGQSGFGGDGGPATEALFQQPEGIAFDRQGNYFIGDTLNNRIRRVDAATGIITTVAGSGALGASPDGTPAAEVKFLRLARLATDRAGNVYIADSPNHKIQVLDAATGRIRTLAGTGKEGFSGDGGPAREALLSFPEGVILDPDGNVLFADLGNHRVRRVDAATGIITTIAGTGEKGLSGDGGPAVRARLWSPGRLAWDRGDLYIADILNARIRKVERGTGIIRTVVGSGSLGDGGPARDASLAVPGDLAYAGDALYVSEYGNRRIRRIDLASGRISTVAGGGLRRGDGIPAVEAELLLPEGISLAKGNLYIADSLGHRIWRLDLATGLLHVAAGNGEEGMSGDGGPAREARLRLPGAVAVMPDGTLVIADFGNARLRAVDPGTGVIRTLEGPATMLRNPVVSLWAAEGFLYGLVSGDPDLYRLDIATGHSAQLRLRIPGQPRPEGAFQLADVVVQAGGAYLADTLAHRVLRVSFATGEVEAVAGGGDQGFAGDGGPALEASLFRPGAIVAGDAGELFIADTFNHRVRRIRPGAARAQEGSR